MMISVSTHTVSIKKFKNNQLHEIEDKLAIEEPLEIKLRYGSTDKRTLKNLSVTMRTPGNDEELAIGFLFTEGIIQNKSDLDLSCLTQQRFDENSILITLKEDIEINLQKLDRHFYTTSSCGVCGKSSIDAIRTVAAHSISQKEDWKIDAENITQLPALLQQQQEVFQSTGGLHASALFSLNNELIALREDVGRHNALDKLIGHCLLNDRMLLSNSVLLLSGRASFELIQKAAMAGIQMVAAVGAPSSLAVNLANEFGMTLIGFLRENRFNIYCGEQRVIN
jgi:FdhD protein